MGENLQNLLKDNQQKLEIYRAHGFHEVAIISICKEDEIHKHPKKIVTIEEAEKIVKEISKKGLSFMAVG